MRFNYVSFGYLLLAVLSGIFYGFGGTILKKGAMNFKLSFNVLDMAWKILTTKYILISLVCSAAGYILYMVILKKAEVITSVFIIQGVLFLSTIIFAHLLFRERISLSKILSFLLITAGIFVLLAKK
ncbi:MAG: EamA family transporter [Candidatus Aminicenantales bacterium]